MRFETGPVAIMAGGPGGIAGFRPGHHRLAAPIPSQSGPVVSIRLHQLETRRDTWDAAWSRIWSRPTPPPDTSTAR